MSEQPAAEKQGTFRQAVPTLLVFLVIVVVGAFVKVYVLGRTASSRDFKPAEFPVRLTEPRHSP